MDWNPISFEPNLKFVLDLQTDDLKRKYMQQHEKANQTMKQFSLFLQNIYNDHQKLLADNIELFIQNEQFKLSINKCQCNSKVLAVNETLSLVQDANINCSSNSLSNVLNLNNKLDDVAYGKQVASKENVCEQVSVFSSDFLSDVEDDISYKHNSPPTSIKNSPTKVQNSPILSKRRKFNSKKKYSTSNTSSQSINSTKDNKLNQTNSDDILEKNISCTNADSDRETENMVNRVPLQNLENSVFSKMYCDSNKNKSCKLLSISKTKYDKTDYLDNGKRLKQTVLAYKKVVPTIDISKTLNDVNNLSTINSYKCKSLNPYENMIEPSKTKSNEIDDVSELNANNNDVIITDDDELIEKSFAHAEKSKIKHKLNFTKRLKAKTNIKSSISQMKSSAFMNNESKQNKKYFSENINPTIKASQDKQFEVFNKKRKSIESYKNFNDDTYFSPAEVCGHRNVEKDYKEGIIELESEEEQETPPSKKLLLNSFDVIPGRNDTSSHFAYKEAPIRKKSEKAQLPGWVCRDCEKWYGHMTTEERECHKNQCSKHRGKFKPDVLTPDSFWNPGFDDTNNSSLYSN